MWFHSDMESRRVDPLPCSPRPSRRTRRLLVLGALVPLTGCGSVTASAPTTAPPPALILVPIAAASVLGDAPAATSTTAAVDTAPATTQQPVTRSTSPAPTISRPRWVPPAPLVDNPFAQPVGNWLGGDIPRVYPLPDGREVWWLNDSFIPQDGQPPVDQFEFVRNIVFIRGLDGSLEMRTGEKSGAPWDFLADLDPDHFHRFLWPLGGMVDGSLLKVFVAEMECEHPKWAVCSRPIATWLATYRWSDMSLLDLRPAANPGVRPVYGFSVVSDADWTYLFGAGVEYNTPDVQGGSDQTFVARVPRGKLEQVPSYWDGTGWGDDPARAVPLIERGYADFRMSVIPWKGHYIGVAKEDEFVGPAIFVMSAPAPQGPWTTLAAIPLPATPGAPDIVTYDASPYPLPVDGKLAVIYSTNSMIEKRVFADPSLYRPVLLLTDID